MSDGQFGPPQPGFGPAGNGPIPPQGAPAAPQGGYGRPAPPQQQPWGAGGGVPPQAYPPGVYPPGVPVRKSRKGLWIGLSVLAAVILGGAGVIGYLIYDTAADTGKNKIALPPTFHDLTSDPNDEDTKQLATSLQEGMAEDKASFTQPEPVSGIYRSSDGDHMLVVSGLTGHVLLPSQQVDVVFKDFSANVSNRSDVDAGPLGGRLSCGEISLGGEQGGICVWGDSSSVVVVMEVDRGSDTGVTKDKVVADTQELRKLAEVPK
ncbi:hypothetical protein ACIQF6_13825 [Kitasatospora sp. NPDC092948]|uniref:hypothetical protein n=1 Tax=Kitasatospora sp. NPDC092948 TaxID=3364088 RepID=UPI0037FD321B